MALMLLLPACGGEELSQDPAALLEHQQMINRRVDRVLTQIKATDDQRQRVQRLKNDIIARAQPLHASHQALHKTLRSQWLAPTVDRRLVRQTVSQQLDLARAFINLALERAMDLHDVLTVEQRTELVRMGDQMRQMRRMWHGR